MRKTIIALMAGATLNGVFVNASEAVVVKGAAPCGQWVADEANSVSRIAKNGWLLGYLSGLSVGTNKSFLSGTDNASIFLWVTNYCNTNPLNDLDDAGDAIFYELRRKKDIK